LHVSYIHIALSGWFPGMLYEPESAALWVMVQLDFTLLLFTTIRCTSLVLRGVEHRNSWGGEGMHCRRQCLENGFAG
jgi:hypothetical protein